MQVEGCFADWDGNLRSVDDCGGGYSVETDRASRYVAIMTESGTLVDEAIYFKSLADVERAGIKAPLVSGLRPWSRKEDGF